MKLQAGNCVQGKLFWFKNLIAVSLLVIQRLLFNSLLLIAIVWKWN